EEHGLHVGSARLDAGQERQRRAGDRSAQEHRHQEHLRPHAAQPAPASEEPATGEGTHHMTDVRTAPPLAPTPTASSPSTDVTADVAVRVDRVSKVYGSGHDRVPALDRVSLTVERGEFVCMVGASGCGKSTMLNLVADLDGASAGEVDVHGRTTL